MPTPLLRLPLVLLAILASAAEGPAQTRAANWELNLHAAAAKPDLFEESSGGLQVGGRLFRNFGSGISIGANLDWVAPQEVGLAPFGTSDASLLLYSAEVGYQALVSPRGVFFVGAGYGGARLSLDEPPPGSTTGSTGTLIPIGAGFKVLNRADSPSWAIRVEGRDNLIFLETATAEGGTETEPRNNLEASVGFSLLFGGGEAGSAARDTDRDGVPDPADFCLSRPGEVVDARGCPVRGPVAPAQAADSVPAREPAPAGVADARDADRDGVLDDQDGCLGTPEGVEVAVDGCPLLAAPEAEAQPGDEDGDGIADASDSCPGTLPGFAVDARGCLARAQPGAPQAAAPVARPELPAPEAEGAAAACVAGQPWARSGGALEFDGRSFRPAGFPQPVDPLFLRRVGEHDGVPIYVSDTASPPYTDFWMPRCDGDGVFELFIEGGPAD